MSELAQDSDQCHALVLAGSGTRIIHLSHNVTQGTLPGNLWNTQRCYRAAPGLYLACLKA